MLTDFIALPLPSVGALDHSILFNFLGFLKADDISKCSICFSYLFTGLDSCIVYFTESLRLFNMQEHLDAEEHTYFIV